MKNIAPFVTDLQAGSVAKRRAAAAALGKSGMVAAIPPLAAALGDPHPAVRCEIVQALGRLADSSAVPALIDALDDAEPAVRAAALAALGRIRDPASADGRHPAPEGQGDGRADRGGGSAREDWATGGPSDPWNSLLSDPFSEVREAAEAALLRLGK